MSSTEPRRPADSTENWDDDFEFQPARDGQPAQPDSPSKDPSLNPLKDRKNTLKSDLRHWAEPGPSTPSKRPSVDAENWDDDFQDRADSPLRTRAQGSSPRSRRLRPAIADTENWDDDFEDDPHALPRGRAARWDSSDEDDEAEFGFGDREEDKTVTSRSRRGALSSSLPKDSPPPPVPPIPASFMDSRLDPTPFPRSPTASVFSVPLSGRDSVASHPYSSTAHLALRPTQSSSSFGALPPSPPIHHARERRRLRKKSRPPRVDDNIYELEDRLELPLRPVTPERSMSPPAATSAADPPLDATPSSTGKSSLVSRIGSVGKKWGAARKKRASTGPNELALSEGVVADPTPPRPVSMAVAGSPPASRGWFFRHGGGPGAGSGSPPSNASALPLRHEKSVDRLLHLVGIDHETPSRRKQRIRQALPEDLKMMSANRSSVALDGSPRKPPSSSSASSKRPQGSRHASYGGRRTPSSRGSSVPRSASASVDDVSSRRLSRAPSSTQDDDMRTPRKGRSSMDPEPGSRTFMGGMRKISLTGRHKRSKSSMHASDRHELPRQSTSTTATAVPGLPHDHAMDVTPRPPSRIMPRLSLDAPLLPPIELQPPSPPRAAPALAHSQSEPLASSPGIDAILESTASLPSSHSGTVTATQRSVLMPSAPATLSKPPASPQQSASLGRATQPPKEKDVVVDAVPRRSSLGDLKIPARISQAQVGLRRDLGMVREFANSVEQLRELQMAYNNLVVDVQTLLVETMPPDEPPSRAMSPTLFGLPLPGYRARSNTNPQSSAALASKQKQAADHRDLAQAYRTIEVKYAMSWECAELLIELGGGAPVRPPSTTPSALHADHTPVPDGRRSRERAITLAGDEAKPHIPGLIGSPASTVSPGTSAQWRASTGRHDLSQRQLFLLRDMLNSSDASGLMATPEALAAEDVNRDWHWGEAMSSTITLPSEYSSQHGTASAAGEHSTSHKRKSKLGMRALRDMLRSLKKNHVQVTAMPPPIPPSATSMSLSTASSLNLPRPPADATVGQRPRAKTSVGPESVKSLREHPNSPYVSSASLSHKVSPRRPSLASLFKLGQKSKSSTSTTTKSSPSLDPGQELSRDDLHAGSSSSCQATNDEEDWDQVESASDLEGLASPVSTSGSATVRRRNRRSLYNATDALARESNTRLSKRNPNASQTSVVSIELPPTPSRHRTQLHTTPMPSDSATTRSHARATKLSDVKELAEIMETEAARHLKRSGSKSKRRSYAGVSPSPRRPPSRNGKSALGTGSLRSPPPQLWPGTSPPERSPDPQHVALPEGALSLAMTPENIRPLLENAKEVHARCTECIAEMRLLLDSHTLTHVQRA